MPMIDERLLNYFGANWLMPEVVLQRSDGHYPPFDALTLLGLEWQQLNFPILAENSAVFYEISVEWLLYYVPAIFNITLIEIQSMDCQQWEGTHLLDLFDDGSIFDPEICSLLKSSLDMYQKETLLSIAVLQSESGYYDPIGPDGNGWVYRFRARLGCPLPGWGPTMGGRDE